MNQNLGKIVRLTDGGMIPSDNPFYDQGRVKAQIWSYGHRNPLGIAFDAQGRLVESGNGACRVATNLIWSRKAPTTDIPKCRTATNYDGDDDIPDHAPGDGFRSAESSSGTRQFRRAD